MLAVAVGTVVALLVGFAVRRARRAPPTSRVEVARPPEERLLDPGDRAELDALLASVQLDEHEAQAAHLTSGVRSVIEHRVPLRTVEAVWSLRAVRLRFSDGTALLVSGAGAGAMGLLALQVKEGSVCLIRCRPEAAGTTLVFDGPRGPMAMLVRSASLDQPE